MKKQFHKRIISICLVIMLFLVSASGCAKNAANSSANPESFLDMQGLFGDILSEDFSSVADIIGEDVVEVSESSTSAESRGDASPKPAQKISEVRGVWFSYLEWATYLRGKNEKNFTDSINKIFSTMKNKKLNTFIVHTRSFGDAFYKSEYFPWSAYASGTLGTAPSYDPLAIICGRAKALGISVVAWVNPMRTLTDDEYSKLGDNYQIKKWYSSAERYKYMYKDVATDKWILMPTNPAVAELIANGARELAKNYSISSLHIDDYFYVSCTGTNPDAQYYHEQNPDMSIEDWRRNATSKMVAGMYSAVKSANKDVLFEASPQANLKNNYDNQFIDVSKWLSESGYVDRIIPQVYFGFNNSSKPFDKTVAEWSALIKNKTELVTGLAVYKTNTADNYAGAGVNEWIDDYGGANDIFKRQIECSRKAAGYKGFYFYSFKSIFNADLSVNETFKNNMNNILSIL